MSGRYRIATLCVVGFMAFCGGASVAAPFTPVIDEFWVVKNGSEQFRDSFDDGVLPPSGPQDGNPSGTGNPNTYSVTGPNGFIGESGGRLTMQPSLGTPTVITNSLADTFMGATRLRTTNTGSGSSLELGDSFEVHGLFDLSNLPTVAGQTFGIRVSDRNTGTNFNAGNDVM
jgi:hypothetical protein